MEKKQIMTIDAQNLFYYCLNSTGDETPAYLFDTQDLYVYQQVVKQTADFEECPLYHQFEVIGQLDNIKQNLIIVDFGKIFTDDFNLSEQEIVQNQVRNLIEKGVRIKFKQGYVDLVPFDKSGNMSRQSRITFINEKLYDTMNERLNLGIDFSNMEVNLSKYYAYRGLYLSTSKRVEHSKIKITPETLIIINDKRYSKTGKREILGPPNDKSISLISAVQGEIDSKTGKQKWTIAERKIEEREYVDTPFDGVGLVTPEYARYINKALGIEGATSFQIRIPFGKGMLHEVDVIKFIKEFDEKWRDDEPYNYIDAFGIERDLRKAQILMTESMFKGKEWLLEYCEKNNEKDPMKYYCEKMQCYQHGLYISGTNKPYGQSNYTHLSYQMINTLFLSDDRFNYLIANHNVLVENPEVYICQNELSEDKSVWKKALENTDFKNEYYIASQLRNTRKGLIKKTAKGKLVVKGQTRYLCRDLMPLLACLLKNDKDSNSFFTRCLFQRAYIPFGVNDELKPKEQKNLKYSGYLAFFRSPHLSRNEQSLLQPFEIPEEGEKYFKYSIGPDIEKYKKYVNRYHEYFGHLTGVVMVPRGSAVPLCLGGADFDGDLVNVVWDENVVKSVQEGCYEDWLFRKLPVVKIPTVKASNEKFQTRVPYEHIKNTFSNSIGILSNKAISIAQEEYGTGPTTYNGPKCYECTILTGLEIDAAKNGVRPDLAEIMNGTNCLKSDYLKFYNAFDKMNLKLDDIIAEVSAKSILKITDKNSKRSIKYSIPAQNSGTKINELPEAFYNEIIKYNKSKNKKKEYLKNPFVNAVDDKKKKSTQIRKYKEQCEDLFNLYSSYFWLVGRITEEKKKRKKGRFNIEKQIDKIFDQSSAFYYKTVVIPKLKKKIVKSISKEKSIKEIKEKLNTLDWQFQPYEKRNEVFNTIIEKDGSELKLDDEEKEILFNFKLYGSKMLWNLLTDIEESKVISYEEYSRSMLTQTLITQFISLQQELNALVMEYYIGNMTKVGEKIYHLCLDKLREVIELQKKELSNQTVIASLYDLTKCNDNRSRYFKCRFFWDAFDWETIKSYIVKE